MNAGSRDREVSSAVRRYSLPAMTLHWLMAALLIAQIVIGLYMVELPKRTPAVGYYYNLHKSLGLLAFMLVLLRVWWRYVQPAPSSTGLHLAAWQEKAACLSHRLLYVCMVLIPLLGFTASNFGKHPVRFFGYMLPQFGWDSPPIAAVFRQAHAVAAWLLCALIVLHLLAVAYHLLTSGKLVIQRMVPKV
ncbi:cytochrome b [Noviherbaspirillum saxi]|uniref:Cytochrome b n=1 Tax=Noviherbaspirillum saxi TaxID=2320863 RepID=A0A3A3FIY0_9BURK|nr:cytochrome b [Noviherbaspirillum saxi]RJF95237.1 cytochrome b [Noviherbaspirillum saxi]